MLPSSRAKRKQTARRIAFATLTARTPLVWFVCPDRSCRGGRLFPRVRHRDDLGILALTPAVVVIALCTIVLVRMGAEGVVLVAAHAGAVGAGRIAAGRAHLRCPFRPAV